ncbi:helix-turn-helix transcriptional regulator [Clostridiaceae bacterium 35-E11]
MFGQRLKELRKEKSLNQSEIGKLLNVSTSTIGMYEQGRRDPDTNTLKFLAEYFNVSVDYLLGRTDKREIAIIENDDIPNELRAIGVEYLEVNKELKEKGFTPERIRNLIESLERAGLTHKNNNQ